MAKKRKFVAYRGIERPYTRYSKYRTKSYVRARPPNRCVRFDMGDEKKQYDYQLDLVARNDVQIRDRAIESARQTANRKLEVKLGKKEYKFKVMIYPHHVLRENPLASGAGADRMSTGMKHSFGKPIGVAARVFKDQSLFRLFVKKKQLNAARDSLKKAGYKLPCSVKLVVKPLNTAQPPAAEPAQAAA